MSRKCQTASAYFPPNRRLACPVPEKRPESSAATRIGGSYGESSASQTAKTGRKKIPKLVSCRCQIMEDSERRVPPANDSKIAYAIEERMTIESPPPHVFDGIARYFRSRDNVLDLVVPLKRVGEPGTIALERKIIVELEPHRNRSIMGRYDDRLSFQWRPQGDTRLSFIGSFIIRPSGSGTEVVLKGEYRPPFEPLDPSLGVVFDDQAAHATGRVLLEGIRAALGAEGEMFQEFKHVRETEVRDRRLTTGWKASSSGETYVRRENDK